MQSDDALDLGVLSPLERLSLRLRRLFEQHGFIHYRMSRFEEYGLYQENRRFLSGEQVITFTDLDGRLLALKPDVTLSMAKNAGHMSGTGGRFYYLENVYRPGRENRAFEEISQMGLECIGPFADADVHRVVIMAVGSLRETGRPWALETGHMGFVTGLFDACHIPERLRPRLLTLIRDRNSHELTELAASECPGSVPPLRELCTLSGEWEPTLARAETLVKNDAMAKALRELRTLHELLTEKYPGMGETVFDGQERFWNLNLSLVNDMDYYNGLVLRGFVQGVPRPVLLGGQYDLLAQRFHPGTKAIGFALYLNELERDFSEAQQNYSATSQEKDSTSQEKDFSATSAKHNISPEDDISPERSFISVALPKGRLGDKVYRLLSGSGYAAPEDSVSAASRKLVVENPESGIRYFLVKPSDVCVYVERGAADIGIVGKDILEESGADVYELLDTGLGKCRMCVAAPETFTDHPDRTLRVATKFVRIAKRYYAAQGRDIDIIKLHGSIELAPLTGLSDVIVDIVETGTTLRENHLRVLSEFMPISARVIANRSSYQFRRQEIDTLVETLGKAADTP